MIDHGWKFGFLIGISAVILSLPFDLSAQISQQTMNFSAESNEMSTTSLEELLPINHINVFHYVDVPGPFNAGTAQGAVNDISAAINDWKAKIDTPLHPCSQLLPVVNQMPSPVTGENNIYFETSNSSNYPFDPTVVAFTIVTRGVGAGNFTNYGPTFRVGPNTRAMIYLNTAKSFNNSGYTYYPHFSKWMLKKVVAHEIGHVLGLTHNTFDPNSIMNPANIVIGSVPRFVTQADGDLAHMNNCQ